MLQQLRSWWPGALAGLVAIALGLAVSELVARLVDGASLVVAIGDIVIDNSPSSVSKWAIDTFGTKDKPILVAGVTVTTLAVGTGLGLLSMRYRLIGVVGLAALSVVGGLAAAHDPLVSDADALATAASAAVAGIAVLLGLLWTATATRPAAGDSTDDNSVPRMERRQFLLFSGGGLAVAALMAPLARRFIDTGVDVDAQRASIVLPKASGSSRTQQAAAAATATPAATPDTSSEATATSTPSAEETAEATAATETPTATETATPETSDTAAADQADAEATPESTPEATPERHPSPHLSQRRSRHRNPHPSPPQWPGLARKRCAAYPR